MNTTMLFIEVGRVSSIPDNRSTPIVAALMSVETSLACLSLWSVLAVVDASGHSLIKVRVLLPFIA